MPQNALLLMGCLVAKIPTAFLSTYQACKNQEAVWILAWKPSLLQGKLKAAYLQLLLEIHADH